MRAMAVERCGDLPSCDSQSGSSKRRPVLARKEEGVALVSMIIGRSGEVSAAALLTSSGYKALEREAFATVRRPSPFLDVPRDVDAPLKLQADIELTVRR